MRFIGADEVRIRISIEMGGKECRYDHLIDRIGWERVAPPTRAPLDPMDAYDAMQRAEERRRLIDMVSSKIAHALVASVAEKYAEAVK